MEKLGGIHVGVFDNFLDPLLLMPILLHLYLWERRVLFGKPLTYVLPLRTVLVLCLLISIVAELLFPRISEKFTSDWMDVLCYMIGSAVFFTFFNRPSVY